MPGPEPSPRVKVQKPEHGAFIPIAESHLEEMGLDPDEPIEVSRYVFEGEAEMRLRFYQD